MKKIFNIIKAYWKKIEGTEWLKALVVVSLIMFARSAFATDQLAGTTDDTQDTVKGTGLTWALLIEGVIAIGWYIKSRNLMSLVGVLVVSLFINDVLFGIINKH